MKSRIQATVNAPIRRGRRNSGRISHTGGGAGDGPRRSGRSGSSRGACADNRAQVNAQLRPGADASRAEAELAAARTQLIQAQQAKRSLAQSLAVRRRAAQQIALAAAKLLQLPPEEPVQPLECGCQSDRGRTECVVDRARKRSSRSWSGRISRAFTCKARPMPAARGAELNGERLGGLNGLAPNAQNYALGFSVTFPVFDSRIAIRAREAGQSATIRAETARSQQIAVDLRPGGMSRWRHLKGRGSVAANTPVQVNAAARRDPAGARPVISPDWATSMQVAEAQRLLTQAEIDDALARLGVWRDCSAWRRPPETSSRFLQRQVKSTGERAS